MIRITFYGDEMIYGFKVSGHAGMDDPGRDIICASISSAAYMTVNTVTDILFAEPEELAAEDGEMILKLNLKDADKCRDILNGFRLHVVELSKQYPEFIKVTEKE